MTQVIDNKIIKTAAEWTAEDPVLPFAQEGIESDTKAVKIGDGVTSWTSLEYEVQPNTPGYFYTNPAPTSGQFLGWNGSAWVPGTLAGTPTVAIIGGTP